MEGGPVLENGGAQAPPNLENIKCKNQKSK
jgi:hypothetical protein